MDIDEIRKKVISGEYRYSIHADEERKEAGLEAEQVLTALLVGQILEQYADTGRGVSCLVIGFANEVPIHIVCGRRGSIINLITVYVPGPPKFVDPWTREA